MSGKRIVDAALTALLPVTLLLGSVLLGLALNMTIPSDSGIDTTPWTPQPEQTATASEPRQTIEASDDGFARIKGGTFLMGSPETENRRIYSGGSTLSEDVSNWLKTNGII